MTAKLWSSPIAGWLFIAASAGWFGACEGGASPVSLVEAPRILAIRADPPVVGPADRARLAALVAGPEAEIAAVAADEVRWRVCDPWQLIGDPTTGCPPERSVELDGDGFASELDVADALARFPVPDGYDGQPAGAIGTGGPADEGCGYAYVELVVVLEVDSAAVGARLLAVKRVRLSFQTADGTMSPGVPIERSNPVIEGLTLDGRAAPGQFEPGREYELHAAPRVDSLGETCADDGSFVPESVRVYLYADGGEFADRFVDTEYTAEGAWVSDSTTWIAPDAERVRFWLVAIDGDGGVGWTEAVVTHGDGT